MSDLKLTPVQMPRRAVLRDVIKRAGGLKDFVEMTGGRWSRSYISQLTAEAPKRAISERTAREIEVAAKLRDGELDGPGYRGPDHLYHGGVSNSAEISRDVQSNLLVASIQVVSEVVGEYGNDAFNPGRHGRIVALVYQDAVRKGGADASYARDLIEIQKAQ